MEIKHFDSDGPVLIKPKVFRDERGYFFETFNEENLKKHIFFDRFVQDNESFSNAGVLRGMHFQKGEHAQSKLVRVVTGAVYDVVVNCNPLSQNFGKVYTAYLSGENKHQFFVPKGFAHGFVALKDNTIFAYKCDNLYNKESEGSFRWDSFGFIWPFEEKNIILSEKDGQNLVKFSDIDFTRIW
jgi:dTDP-4-dehydrorhamnose 3,5-epimerase